MTAQLIWVQSGRGDGRVALYEQHPDHPGGEAFVAQTPVQVARTPAVERKLAAGDLAEVRQTEPVKRVTPVAKQVTPVRTRSRKK